LHIEGIDRPNRRDSNRAPGQRVGNERRGLELDGAAHRKVSSSAKIVNVAPVLAALGDESRLQIVSKLCKGGPLSITKLTEGADISRQAVTKHLLALNRAGLVRSERKGRQRIWELEPTRLDDVRRYLAQISEQWDDAISRLRAVVEE
jgi:DNA-binding transcriptional ArsR family regulator